MVRAVRAVVAVLAALPFLLPPTASAATLKAGVGRSDVTPPTGFPTMGYVRSDSVARGQHTRLFARAIVLSDGTRKLAGRTVTSRRRSGKVFTLPVGARVAAGAARDRYGNRNGAAVTLHR